jgi:quercetin dioxygenase-like cupin family protein
MRHVLVLILPLALGGCASMPDGNDRKVSLVYDRELPNVPGKSVRGVLVEYGPDGWSPPHVHAQSAFIYATVVEGAVESAINGGPVVRDSAGQSWTEMPGDRHDVSRSASSSKPARLLAVFVVNTDETELAIPLPRENR